MLISLPELIKKYGLNIRGVVHVGAHHLEEYPIYKSCGINDIVAIEPCTPAFNHMVASIQDEGVMFVQCACGEAYGSAKMNVEKRNGGQSNSILKPQLHKDYYPDIVFNETEMVEIRRLDDIPFDRTKYNMLCADTQGYESFVLKGAKETLKHIDAVYLEVNSKPLYEGCAMIEDLDKILSPEFERVETFWVGQMGWGDSLWVRSKEKGEKIVSVPKEFRPREEHRYPEDNNPPFEEWLEMNLSSSEIPHNRHYLPILWTGYLKNHNYGKDERAIKKLQEYVDSLDRTKKYFTVVQYDDGPLVDFKDLNIKVFSMSGGNKTYPLPLICQPHRWMFNFNRSIFASFVGRPTHPVRREIIEQLKRKQGYFMAEHTHGLEQFCRVLADSVFAICPRGYGPNSFRIQEAIQYGAIPVYVSDEFIHPHNVGFESYGVVIHESDVASIDKILRSLTPEDIKVKQMLLPNVFRNLYSFEGNKKLILEHV